MSRMILLGIGLALMGLGWSRFDELQSLLASTPYLAIDDPQRVVEVLEHKGMAVFRSGVWLTAVGFFMTMRAVTAGDRGHARAGT